MSGENLFKTTSKEYNCETCRDTQMVISKGRVQKCPECKNKVHMVILDESTIEEKQKGIVPENYRELIFDTNKLTKDPRIDSSIKSNDLFLYYTETLKGIFNNINTNTKLGYSILITAPQGMGKNSLVYSCLNAAIRNGKTVAPYLDSLEINSYLLKDNTEIIHTLTTADVCFIKIPSTNLVGAMRALMIIIDRRARNGLPTIVTSRFDLNYLYKIDMNLKNLFIAKDFGDALYDYSRLRVVSSVYPEFKAYSKNKYDKK